MERELERLNDLLDKNRECTVLEGKSFKRQCPPGKIELVTYNDKECKEPVKLMKPFVEYRWGVCRNSGSRSLMVWGDDNPPSDDPTNNNNSGGDKPSDSYGQIVNKTIFSTIILALFSC